MGGMSYKPQRERERERSKTARKTLSDQHPLPVFYKLHLCKVWHKSRIE
jgi:hypothetical protein